MGAIDARQLFGLRNATQEAAGFFLKMELEGRWSVRCSDLSEARIEYSWSRWEVLPASQAEIWARSTRWRRQQDGVGDGPESR